MHRMAVMIFSAVDFIACASVFNRNRLDFTSQAVNRAHFGDAITRS
jgi:hypothetical protein